MRAAASHSLCRAGTQQLRQVAICNTGGIGLIRIQMQLESEVGPDPDCHIAESQVPLVTVDPDLNGLAIAYTEPVRVLRIHMDMSAGTDDSALQAASTRRPFHDDAGCGGEIAREAHRRLDAKGGLIGA